MAGPHGEGCVCPENTDEEGVFRVLGALADKVDSRHVEKVSTVGIAVTILFQDGTGWSAGWASMKNMPSLRDAMAKHLTKVHVVEEEVREMMKPEPGEVGN